MDLFNTYLINIKMLIIRVYIAILVYVVIRLVDVLISPFHVTETNPAVRFFDLSLLFYFVNFDYTIYYFSYLYRNV